MRISNNFIHYFQKFKEKDHIVISVDASTLFSKIHSKFLEISLSVFGLETYYHDKTVYGKL